MTAVSARRVGAYAVLGLVAVLAVLWYWSTARPARQSGSPVHAVTSEAPVIRAADGLVVPNGTDVELDSGQRYGSPWARVVVSGTVLVDVTVTAPSADGDGNDQLTVRAPVTRLVTGGGVVDPVRTNGDTRDTVPGGTVSFTASFDDVDVRGGDVVTVLLGLGDGVQVEYADVPVVVVQP